MAFTPKPDHFGDERRRMLQVRVHHDDGVPARRIEPGGQGDLMAEISGKGIDTHGRIAGRQRVELFERRVPAPVIDEDNAMIQFRNGLQHRLDRLVEEFDDIFLVVTRGHDAEELRFAGHSTC